MMTVATGVWLLFIGWHVGYGDTGALVVRFPSREACTNAIAAVSDVLWRDKFVCISADTGNKEAQQ